MVVSTFKDGMKSAEEIAIFGEDDQYALLENAIREPAGDEADQRKKEAIGKRLIAQARKEEAMANMAELNVDIKRTDFLPRAMVREIVSKTYASLTQSLRSIRDNLERQMGLDPDVLDAIARHIDDALEGAALELEKFE